VLAILCTHSAAPALAQSTVNETAVNPRPSDINQRLQLASEKIEATAPGPRTADAKIGPGDLLNISVFEAPDMNSTVRVMDSGEISVPLLGAVHASGLTSRQLESVLQGLLRNAYLKDPHVGVFVQDLQSHAVSVVGAVKMPGVFQIRGPKTLIEILSMAQGLADDAGNEVLIAHGADFLASDDAVGAESSSNKSAAAAARFTEVFPRAYELPAPTTGKAPEIAGINLKKLLDSSDPALNVTVHPGDIIKVPRAGIVYVVGEVTKPGGFVLQNNEGISVLQALALAQGPTHTAAIKQTRIIRTDPASGLRTEIPANLSRIFSGKAPDLLLQPKDVVFVPNSAAKSVLYRGSEAALQTAAGVAIYKW
jgi:polysaccharide export outer membrane protein